MDFFALKPDAGVAFFLDIVENPTIFNVRDSFKQVFARIAGWNNFPGLRPPNSGERRNQALTA
jgi:hypothetical protein